MTVSEFQREDRYIVIKRSDLAKVADHYPVHRFMESLLKVGQQLPKREFLVVEKDWPEYEPAWQMIERRVSGLPDEMAALREELDGYRAANMVLRDELKTERLRADAAVGDANDAERSLTAAEQRNASHESMLRHFASCADVRQVGTSPMDYVATLQPTESGASE